MSIWGLKLNLQSYLAFLDKEAMNLFLHFWKITIAKIWLQHWCLQMMSLSDREDHPKDIVLNIEQASLSFIANVTRPKRKYSYLDDIVNIYFQKPVGDIRPVLLSSSMSPNNRKKHSYLASLDSCPCFSQQYQGFQSISAASSPRAKTCWKSIWRNILCVLD